MMEYLLINVFSQVDLLIMVFLRIIGFFITVPVFGGRNMPVYAKIGASFIISMIIMSTIPVTDKFGELNIMAYGYYGVKEILIGMIIGYLVYLLFSIVLLAGYLIDFNIGFTMASMFDPLSESQATITENLYYFLILMTMLITNGHHMLIRTIVYSYRVIPVGESIMTQNAAMNIVMLMQTMFIIAIKVAAPVMAVIMVVNVAMGILQKTAPQFNIFVVGMPLKVIIGLFILFAIMQVVPQSYRMIEVEMQKSVFRFIKDVSP
ncbi:MAG: flagellar biosynthetic protein FliR [Clostridia bacterium]|jgi:flagellar biosynthetic protein FliR|nr:flagellar biosynthetic protein FliR [Clostridia bacterium]